MICLHCKKEFLAKTKRAKFCSDNCRVYYNTQFKPLSDEKRMEMLVEQMDKTTWVETGTPLDEITKLPEYKVSIIHGRPGIGKSTIANLTASNFKGQTLYIDTEAALSPERLFELGVDPRRFTTKRLNFIEEVYETILDPETLEKYDLIIWDSVGGTSTHAEAEGEAWDKHMGIRASMMNKLMRQIPYRADKSKTTFLLINHEYKEMGPYARVKLPGGNGQEYAAGIVVRLSGTYPKIRVELKKNRFGKTKEGEIKL